MEEPEKIKSSKRKIEETDNVNEITKKQKTEEKKPDGTIIFSRIKVEEAEELLKKKSGMPWLIRESNKVGLITISVLKTSKKKDTGEISKRHICFRYIFIEEEWKKCPREEDKLAVLMEKMTSLDCHMAEKHIQSLCEVLMSEGLQLKYLMKPTAEQQSQIEGYGEYKENFLSSFFKVSEKKSKTQEKKLPEIDMRSFDEEMSLDTKMSDVNKMSPKK